MSCAEVAGNDDLLTEILLRLPVKPLFRSKCVSRHWYCLISNPDFCHRKSRDFCSKTTGCLLVRRFKMSSSPPEYDVVPLDKIGGSTPGDSLVVRLNSGVNGPMEILQSCNGLFCCRAGGKLMERYHYYVYNPTSGQFRELPDPVCRDIIKRKYTDSVFCVQMAFEPRKSPHYKVVCLYFSEEEGDQLEMEIYSSQTGQWKLNQTGGEHLKMEKPLAESGQWSYVTDRQYAIANFRHGVYWNGAINWLNRYMGDGLYFNVEEERFGNFPMLPIQNNLEQRKLMYSGESYNHLLLVELYDPMATQFDVYEMDRQYSGWSITYSIDIEVVMDSSLNSKYLSFLAFDILSFGWDERNMISFIVLNIQGQAIRYNLGDSSFDKLWDFSLSDEHFDLICSYSWIDTVPYIESIYYV